MMDITGPIFFWRIAMKRTRFPLMISDVERSILLLLARREGASQAAVLRRLIWQAAQQNHVQTGNPARPTTGS